MAAAVALGVVEHALVQLRENLPADDKAAAADVEQMLQSSQRLRGLLRLGDGPASVSADPNAEDEAKQRLRRSSRVLDSGPKALAVLHEGHIQEIMRGFDLTPQVRPERRVQFDSTLEYTECCLSTAE